MHKKLLITAALISAPLAVQAQTFRCIGKDGRHYYGSVIPAPCVGRPVEQLNARGMVIRRIDPEAEARERRAREAEEAQRRAQEIAARDAERRDRALLATYTSVKEIEWARGQALAENDKAISLIEDRMALIRRREDAPGAAASLEMEERALEARRRQAEEINARFDEERRRYLELTGKRSGSGS